MFYGRGNDSKVPNTTKTNILEEIIINKICGVWQSKLY